ncbi:MAG: response regulator transcription factor [Candidatus Cohnella colombiensis]|uniref:Response regulator transcription factor n=1 Tax=Candidatus Cohnella colombiensis TaxID=3121368 RepID=A0AA95F4D2_9BACL|nr:MAG: response regulator transcription factor [Cohnella sp.]
MYSILIVDDEPLIREGLRTIIDWEEHGFRVVDVASDAAEALRKHQQLEPSLMIVDIRMPGMDGLELLRKIHEQYRPCPHFLILSGYADFEYARTALQLKVDGYLLKPIDEDELISYLRKVKDEIDEDNRVINRGRDRDWESRILELLSGKDPVPIGTNDWNWSSYEIALVKPLSREEIDAATIAQVKRLLAESFDHTGRGIVFSIDSYVGVLLKETAESPSKHRATYNLINEACGKCGLDFIVVAGGAVPKPELLGRSYERACSLIKQRFLYSGGKLHLAEPELQGNGTDSEAISADDKLFLALDAANPKAAEDALHGMGSSWLAAGANELEIKGGFVSKMSATISRLSLNRPELREHVQTYNAEVTALYGEYRYEHLLKKLSSICMGICDKLNEKDAGPDKQVRKMIELIHRNSSDHLRLETLAEALGYNSSYLGKLFKSTTGDNFNTYLDKVRIDKAKELLRQGKKVYQVAEQIGYTNVDYFHAKFRKYVGSSPISFRKNPEGDEPTE